MAKGGFSDQCECSGRQVANGVVYVTETLPYIYHSQMHPVLKRNTEVCSVTDWLAALTEHPERGGTSGAVRQVVQ